MPNRSAPLLNQLTKGFLTEVTPLTFPVDGSVDELNMFLKRDGSREKRLGLDNQTGSIGVSNITFSLISNLSLEGLTERPVVTYKWRSVGGDPDLNLLVMQLDGILFFFEAGVFPIDDGLITDVVDLDDVSISVGTTDHKGVKCQFASGRGKLFVVNRYIQPSYIEYDPQSQTFTITPFDVMIRDLDGLDDGLAVDERPSTLSNEHYYNLRNQGWNRDAVKVWLNNKGQKSEDPVIAFNEYIFKNGDTSED